MSTKLASSTILKAVIDSDSDMMKKLKKLLSLAIACFAFHTSFAATYSWGADVLLTEGYGEGEIRIDLYGYVRAERWSGIASACGDLFGYKDSGKFYLKEFDRTMTWVADENVTFVLAMYGDLIAADTIESATKVPIGPWEQTDHSGGVAIEDPTDFYLGFMTPESKTADGIPRYGWYHLSIDDDLNDITLLDSGVGLYGESIYVGMGTTPEPSTACLLLIALPAIALSRKSSFRRSLDHAPSNGIDKCHTEK